MNLCCLNEMDILKNKIITLENRIKVLEDMWNTWINKSCQKKGCGICEGSHTTSEHTDKLMFVEKQGCGKRNERNPNLLCGMSYYHPFSEEYKVWLCPSCQPKDGEK